MTQETSLIFQDVKIVELASVVAGPLAGTFFSELGAEVIKIENKRTGGDVTRAWKLPTESSELPISSYYSAVNYNKKSLLLDVTEPTDYDKLMIHIKEADIVISNYTPRTARKLKLSYDDLISINKNLIYAELTGFGDGDSRAAFDVVLQAESGFMYMNGEPNGPPIRMPVALIDVLSAHHIKEAILVAMINKLKTGKGKHIQVSLYESAMASLINQATNYLMEGHIPQRMGTKHPNIAPYGDMYETKDGKLIVLAIGSDKQFEMLCSLTSIPHEGYETNALRLKKRKTLNKEISECMKQKDVAHWVATFKNVPFGIVKNIKEVFEDSKSQKMLLTETIEGVETVRVKTALV